MAVAPTQDNAHLKFATAVKARGDLSTNEKLKVLDRYFQERIAPTVPPDLGPDKYQQLQEKWMGQVERPLVFDTGSELATGFRNVYRQFVQLGSVLAKSGQAATEREIATLPSRIAIGQELRGSDYPIYDTRTKRPFPGTSKAFTKAVRKDPIHEVFRTMGDSLESTAEEMAADPAYWRSSDQRITDPGLSPGERGERIVRAGLSAGPSAAVPLAIGVLGSPALGLAVAGALEGSEIYESVLNNQRQKYPERPDWMHRQVAFNTAVPGGIVASAIEKLPMDALLDPVFNKEVKRRILRVVGDKGILSRLGLVAGRTMLQGTIGTVEETLQQNTAMLAEYIAGNDKAFDDWLEQSAQAASGGFFGEGVFGTVRGTFEQRTLEPRQGRPTAVKLPRAVSINDDGKITWDTPSGKIEQEVQDNAKQDAETGALHEDVLQRRGPESEPFEVSAEGSSEGVQQGRQQEASEEVRWLQGELNNVDLQIWGMDKQDRTGEPRDALVARRAQLAAQLQQLGVAPVSVKKTPKKVWQVGPEVIRKHGSDFFYRVAFLQDDGTIFVGEPGASHQETAEAATGRVLAGEELGQLRTRMGWSDVEGKIFVGPMEWSLMGNDPHAALVAKAVDQGIEVPQAVQEKFAALIDKFRTMLGQEAQRPAGEQIPDLALDDAMPPPKFSGAMSYWTAVEQNAAAKLKKHIRDSQNTLHGGLFLPPPLDLKSIAYITKIVAARIAQRSITFAQAVTEITSEFSERLRPHMDAIWAAAKRIVEEGGPQAANKQFFSTLVIVAEQYPDGYKFSAQEVQSWTKHGVRPEEIEWLIDEELFRERKSIPKNEFLALLDLGSLELKEVELSREADQADFVSKTAQAYRESRYTPEELSDRLSEVNAEIIQLQHRLDREQLSADQAEELAALHQEQYDLRRLQNEGPRAGGLLPRFTQFNVAGASYRPREFYFTLPRLKDLGWELSARFGSSFPFHKTNLEEADNGILIRLRTTERTLEDGRKILLIDEVQSELHEVGRERGYLSPGQQSELEKAQADLNEAIDAETRLGVRYADNRVFELQSRINQLRDAAQPPLAPLKGDAWIWHAFVKALRLAAAENYDGLGWASSDALTAVYGGAEYAGFKAIYDKILPNWAQQLAKKRGAKVSDSRTTAGEDYKELLRARVAIVTELQTETRPKERELLEKQLRSVEDAILRDELSRSIHTLELNDRLRDRVLFGQFPFWPSGRVYANPFDPIPIIRDLLRAGAGVKRKARAARAAIQKAMQERAETWAAETLDLQADIGAELFKTLPDSSFEPWSAAMVEELGEAVRPNLETLYKQSAEKLARMQQSIEVARAAKKGRKPYVRAVPSEDPEAREAVHSMDALTRARGLPKAQVRTDLLAAGREQAEADIEGTKRMLLSRALKPESQEALDTVKAGVVLEKIAVPAWLSGDPARMQEALLLDLGYRQMGTEWHETGQVRYDPYLGPGERARAAVGAALLSRPRGEAEELLRAVKNKDVDTYNRLLSKMEKELNAIRDALSRKGYDPNNFDPASLTIKDAQKMIRDISIIKGRWGDAIFEYYISSLLAAPTTPVVNLISTAAHMGWDIAARQTIEMLVNEGTRLATGKLASEQSAQFGEWQYMMKGFWSNWKWAAVRGWHSMLTEQPWLEDEVLGTRASKTEIRRGPVIKGAVGRTIRYSPMLLNAGDEFLQSLYARFQVGAEAYRIAKGENLSGDALSNRIHELTEDMTSLAWYRAVERSSQLAFKEQGPLVEKLLKLRATHPVLKFFVPFVTVPTNVMRYGVKYTPFGTPAFFFKLVKAAAERESYSGTKGWTSEKNQRLLEFATMQLFGYGTLALLLALTGPSDEDDPRPWVTGSARGLETGERALSYRSEAPPLSLRIGDRYYSYGRVEPFATVLATIVDAVVAVRRERNGEHPLRALDDFSRRFVGQFQDKTFLRGVADAVSLLLQYQSIDDYVSNWGAGWVPNLLRSGARALDPDIRETGKWGEVGQEIYWRRLATRAASKFAPGNVAGKLWPYLSAASRVDLWGNDVETSKTGLGGTVGWKFLVPVRVSDPVNKDDLSTKLDFMLIRWNEKYPEQRIAPTLPRPSLLSIKDPRNEVNAEQFFMTPEEYYRFLKQAGRNALDAADSQDWNLEEPTPVDINKLMLIVQKSQDAARQQIIQERLGSFPELSKADRDRLTQLLDRAYVPTPVPSVSGF